MSESARKDDDGSALLSRTIDGAPKLEGPQVGEGVDFMAKQGNMQLFFFYFHSQLKMMGDKHL